MKMMIPIATAMIALVLSCNKNSNNSAQNETTVSALTSAPISAPTDSVAMGNELESQEKFKQAQSPSGKIPKQINPPVVFDWEKKIIRDGTINFEVKDAKQANISISDAVRANGGYIATASEQQIEDQIKDDITIRIPREKFDLLIDQVSAIAKTVLQKNISSQDLTEEYYDTKSRIGTKEKVRDRYYEFLKQAKNVDEVLKVEDEIKDLQEDIDVATGRANYINHQSVFSTIHLVFFQKTAPTIVPEENPGFIAQVVNSLKDGLKLIETVVIIFVKLWPLLVALIFVWWIVKRNRKIIAAPIANKDILEEK